jgi:hypothetical protein
MNSFLNLEDGEREKECAENEFKVCFLFFHFILILFLFSILFSLFRCQC